MSHDITTRGNQDMTNQELIKELWKIIGNDGEDSNDAWILDQICAFLNEQELAEKIEVLPAKTSTINDIIANSAELTLKAEELINKFSEEDDWWENVTVGQHDFDFNIFYWENEAGDAVRIVTVHPVTHDETGYGQTDMSNFIRLIIKKVEA
jgi:hypothetical protein